MSIKYIMLIAYPTSGAAADLTPKLRHVPPANKISFTQGNLYPVDPGWGITGTGIPDGTTITNTKQVGSQTFTFTLSAVLQDDPSGSYVFTPPDVNNMINWNEGDNMVVNPIETTQVTGLTVPISEFRQFGPFRGEGTDATEALANAKAEAKKTFVLSRKPLTWKMFEADKLDVTVTAAGVTDVAAAASPDLTELKNRVMALLGRNPWDNSGNTVYTDPNGPSWNSVDDNDKNVYGPGTYNGSTDYGSNSLGMCAHFYWYWMYRSQSSGKWEPAEKWGKEQWNIVRNNIAALFDDP